MLNDTQIKYLETRLGEVRLRNRGLKEEFLDHLCCNVEEQMNSGLSFRQAMQTTFDTFQKDEMQDIQSQIFSIHLKKRMMKVSMFVLAMLLAGTGLFWNREPESPPLEIPEIVVAPIFKFEPPSISPIAGQISPSSGFGMRMHPESKKKKHHFGVDFIAPKGTDVLATADGTVEVAVYEKRYGNHIIIRHDSIYQTLYAHLSEMEVSEGAEVKKGTVIGKVGSTGKSTGPHLHYEVIKNGKRKDPAKYIAVRE